MSSYFDLYRGATLSDSLIKHLGANASAGAFGAGVERRKKLLQQGLNTGVIEPGQVGASDADLLGITPSIPVGARQILTKWNKDGPGGGGVGGFVSNLGTDVFNFGKELVPGLVKAGGALGSDVVNAVGSGFGRHPTSHFLHEIIDPTVKGYKQTYAGGGGFSGFLHRFYKHPLGPVLDAATIASLGAGGAAKAGGALATAAPVDSAIGRVGAQLARIPSVEGRPPINLGNEVEFQRLYSRRPLTKLTQIGVDKLTDHVPVLQRTQQLRASRRFTREEYQTKQHLTAAALRAQLPPLEEAFKVLTPNESTALHLTLRGVNTPERLEAFQNLMRNSLEGRNPEGHNIGDFSQADRRHTEHLADLPQEVKELTLEPNEAMVHAAEAWANQVSRGHELLDIPQELHQTAVDRPGNILDDFRATGRVEEGAPLEPHPEEPTNLDPNAPHVPPAEIDPNALPHVSHTLKVEFGSFEAMKHAFLHEDTHLYGGPWGDAVDSAIKDSDTLFDENPELYEQAGNDTHHDFVGELKGGMINSFEEAAAYLVQRLQLHLNDYGKSVNETGSLFGGATESTGISGQIADALKGPEPAKGKPAELPDFQRAISEIEGYTDWRKAIAALAEDPKPGTVIWRGESRADGPGDAETSGMHWTVSPDALVHPRLESKDPALAGHQNIVWEAVLDDPERQAIPRGHRIWTGKSRSLNFEGEVRLRPKGKIRVVGAYVWRGGKERPGHLVPSHPERTDPNWEFVPVNKVIGIEHKPNWFTDEGKPMIDYSMHQDIEATQEPRIPGHSFEDFLHKHDIDPSTLDEHTHAHLEEMWSDGTLNQDTLEGLRAQPHEEEPPPPGDRAIDPNYVPDRDVSGLKWYEPNAWGRKLGRTPGFVRRGPEGRIDTGAITAANLLTSKTPTFERASSGATFAAGAFRTDSRVFLDHVAQRETHVIDKAYKQGLIRRFAAKGENSEGEVTELHFKTQDEVRDKLGADWVLVHPEFPIAWFRAEKNVLKEALNIGKRLVDDGLMPGDPAFESAINHLASVDAQAFIRTNWGAMKRPGVAVPKDFFEYQRALATVNDPFKTTFGKYYQKYINLWRTYTLAYMPRWALNTAVGTFLQAMVHGAINPRDYMLAKRLDKAGELPAGVKLGAEAINEDIGPQRLGVIERVTGARVPTRQLIEGVQAIEDHFRRAMFVKSLKKEDRARLNEMGESVKSWYEKGQTDDERIREMLGDPQLVHAALSDVNKFAYNYSHLGPFERRYVRQFVPFWGWYKFITKLAWRLPAEYPGRSRVMSWLSNVGLDQQDQLGPIPDWLKGIIPLNLLGGHLKYLSTIGINPFSQFANPIAPHGAVNGLLQLGQFSPVIQAVEQAYGLDPLTGDSVRISPQSHVARDILGRLVDTRTGEQVAPASIDPLQRGVMALLRAFPQFRLGEKYALEGGGSVYPESMPFIHERPMAPAAPGSTNGILAELGAATGMLPKVYDLGKYQSTTMKMLNYARTRNQSDLRRLSRKFNAPQP